MKNLSAIETTTAQGKQKELFGQIQGAFGVVPNMFRVIGNSAAALESMWTSFTALGGGELDAKTGEQIAVLVANINRCEYCLAAHTVLGQKAGATESEMSKAQSGHSDDPKTNSILAFSAKLVTERGQVSNDDIESLRSAGCSDAEIAEILAHVALNIFTNYTNVAFGVPIDFPKVNLKSAA